MPAPPPAQPVPFPTGSFCRGDERMSFSPVQPVVGNTVTVQVTSAQAASGVGLSGRFDTAYHPFVVRPSDIDKVQYGSDDTKTHRKIKHILGQAPPGRVGRLLVSELFTDVA